MDAESIRDKLVILETKTEYVIGMLEKMDSERSGLRDNLNRFAEVIRKEHSTDMVSIHDKIESIKIEVSDLKLKAALTSWVGAAVATIIITLIATSLSNGHQKVKPEPSRSSIREVIPRRLGGFSEVNQIQSEVFYSPRVVQGTWF